MNKETGPDPRELGLWLDRHGPTGPGEHGLLVQSAHGVWLDTIGHGRFLDLSQGGVLPLGYGHPCVQEPRVHCAAVQGFEWPERAWLMHKLAEIVPGGMNRRVMLCDSGREALAQATSLACRTTGRTRVAYLADVAGDGEDLGTDLAAVVVHPLDSRFAAAADPCRGAGALLIDDESSVAPGTAGRMLAIGHSGVRPDLYVLGRGLAAGMAIGACVTGRSTLRWPARGSGGTPAACLAALTYINMLEAGLLDTGRVLAEYLARALKPLGERPGSFRVVGAGLALGLRFERPAEAARFLARCRDQGLVLGRLGERTLSLAPPLTVTESELGIALEALRKALDG